MKTDVLLVSDKRNSPLSIAAKSRAKLLGAHVIFASDFKSPNDVLRFISRFDYKKVLFCWRGLLIEGLSLPNFRRMYVGMSSKVTFHCLIPDFVGLTSHFIHNEANLLKSIHGYWVTCEKLFTLYTQYFVNNHPDGVLHDIPDVESIRIKYSESQTRKVIWVGNSKWGQRLGFHDHKGFESIVKPLISKFKSQNADFDIEVIDSSVKKIQNPEVLRRISQSRVLIQASSSEGTGLPVLEALGLGVVPVTTDVGVASEILVGSLSKFIVGPNILQFEIVIQDALAFTDRSLLTSAFLRYVKESESESIVWRRRELEFPKNEKSFAFRLQVRSIWLFRYLSSRKKKKGL